MNDDLKVELVQSSEELYRQLNVATSRKERVEVVGLYLESLATVAAAGMEVQKGHLDMGDIREALEALDPDELMEEADKISRLINEALDCPHDTEALEVAAVEIEISLLYRQRWTRRIMGAKMYTGVQMTPEQEEALEYFEALLRPMVWALAFMNGVREGHTTMIVNRDLRPEHWYWAEALGVSWEDVCGDEDSPFVLLKYPTYGVYRHTR